MGKQTPTAERSGETGERKPSSDPVIQLLDEWLADESGYDERVWPQLKKGLEANRLSSRRLFRD